ncbi:MAG: rhomboid family intramembrane serine protease [Flavobacteriaceae bacterium]|nr:rhomboid family intramembrane serine protease [Flavobacteriaceae bacterium]
MSFEVLVIIILNVFFTYKGFNDYRFFEKFRFKISDIRNNESFRLISSGFLHVDNPHLIFNMITFYFFGDIVLNVFGTFWFICIYIGSLLLGNLFSLIIHRNKPNYSAVGASGAVTGILFSAILTYPDLKLALLFFPIPIPGYIFGLLYLAYTFYGMKNLNDGIGHSAHLGGAIGGILLSILLIPEIIIISFKSVILLLLVTIFGTFFYKK